MVQDALANDSSCGCTLWHQYGQNWHLQSNLLGSPNQRLSFGGMDANQVILNVNCWVTFQSFTDAALSIFSLDAVLRSPNSHLGESIIQALVPLEWNSTLSATARPRIISGPRGFPVISAKQAMDGHSQTVLAQVFNRSERGPSVKSHSSGTGEAEAVASAHH